MNAPSATVEEHSESAKAEMEHDHQMAYDRAASLRRLRGSHRLLRDMACFFHEDAPKLIRQLQEALEQDDLRSVTRAAHTLRGLSATFDAVTTMDAAERLETLASAREESQLSEAATRLAAEIELLDRALECERNET